jgi:uncharacterized protein with ParB-like and HNH nuclease domain
MKKWQIEKTSYSVGDFIAWQKDKILILNPDFQRRAVWSPGAKSFLIDTVIRGFPMPVIFLREQKTDLRALKTTKEVVDGQQRIRTLLSYIDPNLLDDYDPKKDYFEIKANHNRELAKKKFNELDEETRRNILEYKFGVHLLPSNMEDRDVLQIFARMNASGVKLNDQEVRNAVYTGPFKTTAYELAFEQVERWKKWKVFKSMEIARMLEVELISEFMMMMLNGGIMGKSQKSIEAFYIRYEEKEFGEGKEISRRLRAIMDTIEDVFSVDESQSILTQRTLFYSLFALLYELQFGFGSFGKATLKSKSVSRQTAAKIETLGNRIARGDAPKKVLTAYQKNTTNIKSRTALFEYLKKGVD